MRRGDEDGEKGRRTKEKDRLGGWRTSGADGGWEHLEGDETWSAVEIGMGRCDVETVWGSFLKSSKKRAGGEVLV